MELCLGRHAAGHRHHPVVGTLTKTQADHPSKVLSPAKSRGFGRQQLVTEFFPLAGCYVMCVGLSGVSVES